MTVVATKRRTKKVLEAEERRGQVVSATKDQAWIVLEGGPKDRAVRVLRGTDAWPVHPPPAVRVWYRCRIQPSKHGPIIVACMADEVYDGASPLPAPEGLPGPPDLLPVYYPEALKKLLKPLRLGKKQEAVSYLIRRAYGQGIAHANHQAKS